MKGFGVVLLVLGAIVGLLFNWIAGAALAVIGLLLIIAGGQGQKAQAMSVCAGCGNPVAKTANLCPTCGAKLIPTEGPLAPRGKDDCPICGMRMCLIMGGRWGCPNEASHPARQTPA